MSQYPRGALMDNLEVCRVVGVKPDTWRKRVAVGTAPLPFSRQGARMYYRRSDVRFYLLNGLWPATMKFNSRQVAEAPAGLSGTSP